MSRYLSPRLRRHWERETKKRESIKVGVAIPLLNCTTWAVDANPLMLLHAHANFETIPTAGANLYNVASVMTHISLNNYQKLIAFIYATYFIKYFCIEFFHEYHFMK